eukprot:TRINITY_DN1242_c0_g1_i5.p1 TRINITY_DN1242_c0_g1~~TRINITY_DN1242_c0_g1_i5.p1  ORF type:complete len:821 (+),score=286.40 TRINITY_DN1242_c0_g1_i5:130-2592(+)
MLLLVFLLLAEASAAPDFPWYNPTLPIEQRVAALVGAMSVDEKVSQMMTVASAIDRLAVPAYGWWSEASHGVAWAGVATVFPAPIAVISTEGRAKYNYARQTTNTSGSLQGITFFAPNLNLFTHALWGRGQETFGECPYLTSRLAVAYISGMQQGPDPKYTEVVATAKHALAYNLDSDYAAGGDNGQYRLGYDAYVSQTDLYQTFLPAFEASIKEANVRSVMCSYNGVNGSPMCASPLLQSVLRDQWGFDGYIVSDCGAVEFMVDNHHFAPSYVEASAAAVSAGVDLDCGSEYSGNLQAALARQMIQESDLDTAVSRLFTERIRLGMFDPPSSVVYNNISIDVVDSPPFRQVAYDAAVESIVLLRNEGGLLPLKSTALKRIAVLGPNANRTDVLVGNYNGCSEGPGQPIMPQCTLVTPLAGLQQFASSFATVSYAQGCDIDTNDTSGFAAGVALAKASDVVVVCLGLITCQETGDQCQEAEAHDRTDVALPGVQQQFLQAIAATGTPVVLVLLNGGPVSSPWAAANIPAIVEIFYPGEEAGHALADVLFGKVSPAGRLPYTVPQSVQQLPPYLDMHMATAPGRTYRYITNVPLYRFGYGLSYTTFAYSNFSYPASVPADAAATFNVSVTVTNVGAVDSDEVVQLYFASQAQSLGRQSLPLQELKGFRRIHIVAGQSAVVQLQVPVASLRLADVDGSYAVLPGVYDVWIGGTSPGPSSGANASCGFEIEQNVDYDNCNDLNISTTTDTADECCSFCQQYPNANAFSWNGPGGAGNNGCYCKAGRCNPVSIAGHVSGYKSPTDVPGATTNLLHGTLSIKPAS